MDCETRNEEDKHLNSKDETAPPETAREKVASGQRADTQRLLATRFTKMWLHTHETMPRMSRLMRSSSAQTLVVLLRRPEYGGLALGVGSLPTAYHPPGMPMQLTHGLRRPAHKGLAPSGLPHKP